MPLAGLATRKARMAVEFATVVIPGYRQGILPGTGPALIYDDLYRTYDSRSQAMLLFRSWRAQAEDTARLINASRPKKLSVVGYSYGCGWGVPQLAKALVPFALKIDMAILIDPVPRFHLLKPISLTRLARYRVPRDIRVVHTFRQANVSPFGRQLAIHAGTSVGIQEVFGSAANLKKHGGPGHHVVDDDIDHAAIDNDYRVRTFVTKLIDEWTN